MKFNIVLIIGLLISLNSLSQVNNLKSNSCINTGKKVKVKDWNKKIFLFPDDYWDNKKEILVKQVGKNEFERIKIYSKADNTPCQMLLYCGGKLADTALLNKKLSGLNVFEIASYEHVNNKGVKREWSILRVPYGENKNWDAKVKWDTLYFVVRKEVVEELL